MATTIQISDYVKKTLEKMKVFERETYNEIIENLIEDQMEINEKTKKELDKAKKGKSISHKEVKKILGYDV